MRRAVRRVGGVGDGPTGMTVRRRTLMRWCCAGLLLLAGCGNHADQQVSAESGGAAAADPAAATAADPAAARDPSEIGPCDQDHRDLALALAKAAALKRLGDATLSNPSAEFERTYLTAQLPHQPEPPRAVGWMIGFDFRKSASDEDDAAVPAMTGPLPAPIPQNAVDARTTAGPEQSQSQASTPPTGAGDQTPPSAGPASSAALSPVLHAPVTGAAPAPRPSLLPADQHIDEFVHVDGTVTDLLLR
jgi:hypothetical protein